MSAFAPNIIKRNFIAKKLYNSSPKSFSRELDKKGVPLTYYAIKYDGKEIGFQRNPVTICSEAKKFYNEYLNDNNKISRNYFLNNVDWIVENSIKKNNYSLLGYNFSFPRYNLRPIWFSAMANGLALEILINAYDMTQDLKYLKSAKNILNAFFVNVEEGGITYKDSENEWWYEEYASSRTDIKISRVLNGMMYALIGINYYFERTKDSDAKILFDKGINSLKKEIFKYNDNGYSFYDILGNPSNNYHQIHVHQTKQLFDLTGEQIFNEYHNLWKKYKPLLKIPIPGYKTFFVSWLLLFSLIWTIFFIASNLI